ncbi:MAG: hypothetical protein UZ14_CFX002000034 [Chloroflexi bacterium OLB14]|nr:MAG: hypothetical protein UZ14_CFX002000034 [Chloroflexi bacterium OLB14]
MKKTLLLITLSSLLISCISQATPLPTPTVVTVSSTFTLTSTPESTTTSTALPTATPVPHPMSIIALRNGDYAGSEIVIEKELERGLNYRRYYVYYLSEGLKNLCTANYSKWRST